MADFAEVFIENCEVWDPQQVIRRDWVHCELIIGYLEQQLRFPTIPREEIQRMADDIEEVMPYLLRQIRRITNPNHEFWKNTLTILYFKGEDVLEELERLNQLEKKCRKRG